MTNSITITISKTYTNDRIITSLIFRLYWQNNNVNINKL